MAIAVMPIIAFMGVLISWDIFDRNSLFALLSRLVLDLAI